MKYFKIGNKVYDESYLKENSDLLLFGAMPKEAFLRRILNCYGIDLYYNLENKRIMIKDLENNCILGNTPDSQLWNSIDTTVGLGFDEENILDINIKRKSGLDISLKLDLVNSIDWAKCDKKEHIETNLNNNDSLIEFKYSKYGDVKFTNNKTGYSFKYNTKDLNTNQTKSVAICINSSTNQNSINYSLTNGDLSTIYYNSNDIYCGPVNNKQRKKNYLISSEESAKLFNEELNPLTKVINSDLNDLAQLVPISRLEYLRSYKKNLSAKIKDLFKQIRTAFNSITETKETLDKVDDEILALTSTTTNNNIKQKRYAKK